MKSTKIALLFALIGMLSAASLKGPGDQDKQFDYITKFRRSAPCEHGCFQDSCYRLSPSGSELKMGQKLISRNRKFQLAMQEDGNLVIYCGPASQMKVVWSSDTHTRNVKDGLKFQTDGNLVLYNHNGTSVWTTNTHDTTIERYIMQDDGNFVGYGNCGKVYWASHSVYPSCNEHV